MNRIYLILAIIIFSLKSFSQISFNKYNYIESEERLLENSLKENPSIIGHDSTGFYVLKSDYAHFIEYYDAEMNFIKKSDILKVDYRLRDRQFGKVIYFQDSLYLFFIENKFSKTVLYVTTIDKITLEQDENERMICEIPHLKGNFPELDFQLSLLHNKLLVVFRTDAFIQKTLKFDFYVFDKGLEIDWKKIDYLQYNHTAPKEITYTVDEEGNIHILSLIYVIRLVNHLITDDDLKNEYLAVSYLEKGEKIVQNRISLEDRFVRGIKLIAGKNGSYICSGFYSQMYMYGIKGAFFVMNNTPTKENAPVLFYEFDNELVEKLPDHSRSFRNEEIYSYDIKDLVYRKNGNIVLCGEQNYSQSYNNFNDIIIVCFNDFGQMIWNKSLSKVQSGTEYVSYSLIAPVSENDICILYNEHKKNPLDFQQGKRKSFHFTSPSYLVLARIDEFGNIKKEALLSRTKKELVPAPLYSYDCRDGQIIMQFMRYRLHKYIRLKLF